MDAELLALLEELGMDADDMLALKMASPSIFKTLTDSLGIDPGTLDKWLSE